MALIIVVVFSIVFIFVTKLNLRKNNKVTEQRIYKVAKIDLSATISGSGPIISSNRINLLSKANAVVNKVYYSEGDSVKTGDVLCEFDTSNAVQEVEKYRNDLMQSKVVQQENIKDQKKLNMKAPFNGVVVDIQAEKGDIIQKNEIVFTIANIDKMKFTLPIGSNDVLKVVKGDKVNVNIQKLMQTVKGKITYISDSPYSSEDGGELYNIDITIDNPGALMEGMKVSADIKSQGKALTSMNLGTLAYANKLEVRSETGGTVKSVSVKQHQRVKKGDSIIKLQDDDIVNNIKVMDLKLRDLEYILKNAKDSLNDYKLYSTMDGVISKLNAINGASFKPGDIVAVIVDNKQMEFTIPIDELDIDKIKIGQKADVSFDAIPNTSVKPIVGVVSRIAVEGEPQNGVTTFPVTIKIGNSQNKNKNVAVKNEEKKQQRLLKKANVKNKSANAKNKANKKNQANQQNLNKRVGGNNAAVKSTGILSRLRGGMYANTEIFINSKKNILAVPLESVYKVGGRSYVMVKSDSATIDKLKKENRYDNVFSDDQKAYTNIMKTTQQNNKKNNKQASANKTTAKVAPNKLKQYEEYFSNCIPTVVELGINNENSIEVKSGLKEGDEVVLLQLAIKQTNKAANTNTKTNLGVLPVGNNKNK